MNFRARKSCPVKIVVVAWGASYIERFARFGLASMLAPGNLPAVDSRWDVEFVVMTTTADVPRFEALAALAEAKRYARVRFVPIDDLIVSGLFTVTLTLAYMRGMRVFGQAMTQAHFVFWNADFVMSDGTFSYLAEQIDRDVNVVLAGSVRAVAEDVVERLDAYKDGEALAASGRSLVRLALDHPHSLQIAKTVDQTAVWAESPNHMFWTVGDDAIVARFWQIFMFCLRPTRVATCIDGYCDYSFVPALCPGEPFFVVEDSDKVCLLELQGRDQDHEPVHRGPGREARWRESIAEWSTAEHLEVARQPILFHADGPPAAAADVIRSSGEYVEAIASAVGARPGHAGHYYWIAGVAAWNRRRQVADRATRPLELDRSLSLEAIDHPSRWPFLAAWARAPRRRMGLAGRLQRAVVGDALSPKPLHPDREAFEALAEAAKSARARARAEGARLLIAADPAPWLDEIFPPGDPDHLRIDADIAEAWPLHAECGAQATLVYLRAGSAHDPARVLRNLMDAVAAGGWVQVLAHDPAYGADEGVIEPMVEAFQAAGLTQAALRRVTVPTSALDYAGALHAAVGGPAEGRLAAAAKLPGHAMRRIQGRGAHGRAVVAIMDGVR